MAEFHRGPYETAVGHAELLTEVRIPVRRPGSSAYLKVERRAGDWAVVAAGAAIWLEDGLIADARVGLAAVGPNTTGIPEVSGGPARRRPDDGAFAEAGRLAAASCRPVTDARGSEDYKRHLADELTRRTLRTAADRALAETGTAWAWRSRSPSTASWSRATSRPGCCWSTSCATSSG